MKKKSRPSTLKTLGEYWDKQLSGFDDAAVIRLFKIFSAAALLAVCYAAVFSGFQIVDEYEHLHASWLVSIGKVPYRDFLEHHHPLLWYLSAPVLSVFYDKAIVFYVMRAVSAAASMLMTYYIYKLVLFFGDKKCAWLAVALYLGHLITLYTFCQFRPDTFMNLCFVMGIYYLFVSLKENSVKHLIFSFLGFTFAFLFLQKIALLLMVVEAVLLALILLKKLKIKDVIYAAIPSVGAVAVVLLIFFINGALLEFIEFNYHFNQIMLSYYERGNFWYQHIFLSLYGLAFVSAIYFYKKENIYFKIAAVICAAEFLMRAFYFAPYTHYYSTLTICSAMVLAVLAKKMMPKYKTFSMILIFLMFISLGKAFNKMAENALKLNSYEHYQMVDFVHKNTKPDEMLMNGYDMNFNIYRPDVSYYWFQLELLLPIFEKEYNFLHKLDINTLILQHHPKFIYARNFVDLKALRTYGEKKYTQKFIPEIVRTFYVPTSFKYLMMLK